MNERDVNIGIFVQDKHHKQNYGLSDYYLGHLVPVASLVDEAYRNIALGHDLMEDCGVTAKQLSGAGFTPFEVVVISVLTRNPNETYDLYIERIRDKQGSIGMAARAVKCADLMVNIMNLHNVPLVRREKLQEKYYRALCTLTDAV